MADENLKAIVKEKYGNAALRVTNGGSACGGTASSRGECDPITSNLYDVTETTGLPAEAVLASLGCGNPTALAHLERGETVLDLGSGGGIDVLLSAKRVGPTGKAYGLDMTDEMLALARENQRKSSPPRPAPASGRWRRGSMIVRGPSGAAGEMGRLVELTSSLARSPLTTVAVTFTRWPWAQSRPHRTRTASTGRRASGRWPLPIRHRAPPARVHQGGGSGSCSRVTYLEDG